MFPFNAFYLKHVITDRFFGFQYGIITTPGDNVTPPNMTVRENLLFLLQIRM